MTPRARRWLLRGTAVSAGLAVAGGAAAILVRAHGQQRLDASKARFEAELGPLDVTRYALAGVPAPENAAAWILAGSHALVLAPDETDLFRDLADRPAAEWTGDEAERVRSMVERNAPALEILGRAISLDRSSFGIRYDTGLGARLPGFPEILRANRLVAARARLEASGPGGVGALVKGLEILGRIGRALREEAILSAQLIANHLERSQAVLLRELLERDDVGPGDLAAARSVLLGEDPREAFRRSLGCEGALLFLPLPRGRRSASPWSRLDDWLLDDWNHARALDRYTEIQRALMTRPAAEVVGSWERLQAPEWSLFWADLLHLPNLQRAGADHIATASLKRLARVALALREVALREGAYPADLGAVPESSDADPFNGGRPEVEPQPDGGVLLRVPGLDLALEGLLDGREISRYAWRLPTPPPTRQ
jgi:hypothetical protein